MNSKNWSDRADRDLFFTILSVKNIGVISGSEWVTIGNHMRVLGYGFTNEGCRYVLYSILFKRFFYFIFTLCDTRLLERAAQQQVLLFAQLLPATFYDLCKCASWRPPMATPTGILGASQLRQQTTPHPGAFSASSAPMHTKQHEHQERKPIHFPTSIDDWMDNGFNSITGNTFKVSVALRTRRSRMGQPKEVRRPSASRLIPR